MSENHNESILYDLEAGLNAHIPYSDTPSRNASLPLIVIGAIALVFAIIAAFTNLNLPAGYPNFSNTAFVIFYPIGIVVSIAGITIVISDIAEIRFARRLTNHQEAINERLTTIENFLKKNGQSKANIS